MNLYLAEYGEIHQAKLLLAFSKLPDELFAASKISIIDYGCGQGVASLVLCDFIECLLENTDIISDFNLIEPSKCCLERAINMIHSKCPKADIIYFNDIIENVGRMAISPISKLVVHLFSNVIDIAEFSLDEITHKIENMDEYQHIIVCVSPFYQENGRGQHMDKFGELLHSFKCIYSFEKHIEDWDKDFSCQIRI